MRKLSWEDYLKAPERYRLVDVRDPAEARAEPVEDAILMPLERIANKAYDLPRDRPLALLCKGGQKSSLAALYLEADGFEAYVIEGGLKARPGA